MEIKTTDNIPTQETPSFSQDAIESIPQTNTPKQEQQNPNGEKDNTASESLGYLRRSWLWLLLCGAILFGGFGLLYFGLDSNDEQTKFWTPNALNVLLLIVIVSQAVIALRQWESMERQWQSMERSIEEARISRELENRAFIAYESIKLERTLAATVKSGKMTVKVKICNVGKTPARNVRVTCGVAYGSMTHNEAKFNFRPVRQADVGTHFIN